MSSISPESTAPSGSNIEITVHSSDFTFGLDDEGIVTLNNWQEARLYGQNSFIATGWAQSPTHERIEIAYKCQKRTDTVLRREGEGLIIFGREPNLLPTIEHPNIVRLYDKVDFLLKDKGRVIHSLALEKLEDIDLSTIEHDDVLQMVDEISDALDYIHLLKIVHGDVKYANIKRLKDGKFKLIDFTESSELPDDVFSRLSPDEINDQDLAGLAYAAWGLFQKRGLIRDNWPRDRGFDSAKIEHGLPVIVSQFLLQVARREIKFKSCKEFANRLKELYEKGDN